MTFRNRIKELRNVRAGDLIANQKNFRQHPKEQIVAMRALLEDIGFADALGAFEQDDGKLKLIDGHMRRDLDPNAMVPVLILDITQEEADLMLATFDTVTAKATVDGEALDNLLAQVSSDNEAVNNLLAELGKLGDDNDKIKQINIPLPPRMAWVVIGIPTVRYAEIAEEMEKLGARYAGDDDVLIDTALNNG